MNTEPKPTEVAVISSPLLGVIRPVPKEIAVCPECDGQLYWQTCSTDLREGLNVDCENDPEDQDQQHRYWQGEWQPVLDKIIAWIMATPNARSMPREDAR